ncbi:outer membrane beta-barrel protein [Porphyrobacter sp. CACIAM 03H1]|uniref:outer membrane beta-barrel protein n=1 Tax=Porphyrobacter sp. CACIAM 03H1 TaxID=2003315 RepID=UPI0012FD7F6D|nr:outer membrane beta-barrel protein [Porphyrobacter sp. CACIAM 03H1]
MRHAVTVTGLAGLVTLLSAGTAARAQVAPPPRPAERQSDEFEPVGGRIGSFFLFPSLETRIEYDDNILALPSEGEGDVELTVRGGVAIESRWQRHSLEADAYVQQNFHGRFTTEDVMEGGARLRGRLDISRDTSARLIASLDSLAEDRANITSAGQARRPTRFRRADALFALAQDFGRVQVVGDAQMVVLDFDDATRADGTVLNQDFRDSTYLRASLTTLVEVSPRVSGLLRGQVDRLTYSGNPDTPDPFDRDTTGYAIEAGMKLELSNLLFGEVRAGVLHRQVDDPSADGLTGASFGANLTWAATPLTTLRLFADRQVEEGGSQLVSGNVRSQARVEVEHELLRNLVLEGRAGFARIETIGQVETSADEYNLMVGATWKLDRNFRVFARADRFQRFADDAFFREFTRNRVTAGVRLVF